VSRCFRVTAYTPKDDTEECVVFVDQVQSVTPGRIRLTSGYTVRIEDEIPVSEILSAMAQADDLGSVHLDTVDGAQLWPPTEDVCADLLAAADVLRGQYGDPCMIGSLLAHWSARLAIEGDRTEGVDHD